MTTLRKIAIAAAGAGLLLMLAWVSACLWLHHAGAGWLINRISREYGVEAQIEAVRTNFLTTLTIRGISLKKPFDFQATEAVAAFRPWNFLFPGPDRWVLSVRVRDPRLHAYVPNSTDSPKKQGLLPPINFPFTTLIENGKADIHWKGRTESISGLSGRIDVLPLRVRAELNGSSDAWGTIAAQGQVRPHGSRSWELDLKSDSLPVESLWTELSLSTAVGRLEGPALVRVHAEGHQTKNHWVTTWNAEVKTNHLTWTPPFKDGEPRSVALHAVVTPDAMVLHSAKVGEGLTAAGEIRDLRKKKQANLTFELTRFEIEDAQRTAGIENPILSGLIDGEVRFTGTTTDYKLEGSVTGAPRVGRIQLPALNSTFDVAPAQTRARIELLGGEVLIQRTGENSQIYRTYAAGLSLASLARANNWKGIDGIIDGDASVDLRRGRKSVGSARLRKLEWGRHQATSTIHIPFEWNRQLVSAGGPESPLTVRLLKNTGKWTVEEARLTFGTAMLEARGSASTPNLDLHLKATNLPLDLWPPLLERYPHLAGALDADGRLSGDRSDPRLTTSLIFHGVQLASTGETWNGEADLEASRSQTVLDNVRIDGGYSGRAEWENGAQPRWNVEMTLSDASPALIFEIARTSFSTSGFLDGALAIERSSDGLVARSSVTWNGGRIKDFRFDTAFIDAEAHPDRIFVSDLRLISGGRAFRASGEAKKSATHWSYDALTQVQQWGRAPLLLDGEIRSEGQIRPAKKEIEGRLTAPVAWIGDRVVENLQGRFHYSHPKWSLTGSAAPDVNFNLEQSAFGAPLRGRLLARAFPVETLAATLLGPGEEEQLPTGTMDIDFRMGVPTPDAMMLTLTVPEATWRQEKIGADIQALIDGSTVTIAASQLRLASGGQVVLEGRIQTGEEPAMDLVGTGTDVNLQSVFHLLNWPVRWSGTTNADMTVSGHLKKPEISVAFDGEHEGFGPFREGGRLEGTVRGRGGEWDLSGIRVDSGGGYLKLTEGSRLYVDKNQMGTLRLVSDVRNLGIGVLTLFGRAEVAGRWAATKNDENRSTRQVELDLFARSLWINQFVLDGNVTHLTVRKGELSFSPITGSGQQLSGRLDYSAYPDLKLHELKFMDRGEEHVYLDGFVGADHWDYQLRVKNLDASVVRGLLDTTLPLAGPLEAKIEGKGSVKDPILKGDVIWRNGWIGPVPLDTARFQLDLKNRRVSITDILASRKRGYALTGDAHFSVGEEERNPDIDVVVTKGDIALLADVFPEVSRGRGNFDGRFQMNARGGKSQMSGLLNAHKVNLNSRHFPVLDRGEIQLKLTQKRLSIEQATARIGRGRATVSGFVDIASNKPSHYNLTLETSEDGISVRVPELAITPGPLLRRVGIFRKSLAGVSRGEPRIRLSMTGPASDPVVAGEVEIENSVFTYPPQKDEKKSPDYVPAPRWWRNFVRSVRWDVAVNAGDRTWYQNELVDAKITGGLRFTGLASNLDVDGRIRSEQGAIVYSGNEFVVKDAELEVQTRSAPLFPSSTQQILVYLRATAEKEVFYTDALANSNQDTIVMVVDRSLLGEIQPRFYSKNNPNLSSQRALQLALGLPFTDSIENNLLLPDQRTRSTSREDTDKLLRVGLVQLLDSSLASPLARALARSTGLVDFIRVTYQEQDEFTPAVDPADPTSSSNNITQNQFLRYAKGTKVRFGRELGRRLFADYSFRVDEYEQQIDLRHEVELAYRLRRNLYLRGITELEQERTLGRPPDRRAILENQWRFGLPRKKIKKDES